MARDLEVAILFADVVGSTQLYDKFGDSKASATVALCLDVMKDSTRQFNGTVIKTIGDEVMATFPTVDDAMAAASSMQSRLSNDKDIGPDSNCAQYRRPTAGSIDRVRCADGRDAKG